MEEELETGLQGHHNGDNKKGTKPVDFVPEWGWTLATWLTYTLFVTWGQVSVGLKCVSRRLVNNGVDKIEAAINAHENIVGKGVKDVVCAIREVFPIQFRGEAQQL